MTKRDKQLIWEAYTDRFQAADTDLGDSQGESSLESFMQKENQTYLQTVGAHPPSPDKYPLSRQVSDDPLVQQYVATRLHYYGGGQNKMQSAQNWADEALSSPQPLD